MVNHKTIQLSLFLAALGVGVPVTAGADDPASTDGALTVEVWNIQNDEGQVGCSLYAKKEGFPSDVDKAAIVFFSLSLFRSSRCNQQLQAARRDLEALRRR